MLPVSSTLHHAGNLLTDTSSKGARVSAEAASSKDGCLNLHLVIGIQTVVDAGGGSGQKAAS